MCRLQTQAGAGIKRQLDRQRRPLGGECRQVKPVRCAGKRYNAVPAIWPTAQFVIGKPVPIQRVSPTIAGCTALTERQDSREGLRRPEYRLLIERLFRIGGEKTAPISFEIAVARRLIARRLSEF